jgi:hypothetical protein
MIERLAELCELGRERNDIVHGLLFPKSAGGFSSVNLQHNRGWELSEISLQRLTDRAEVEMEYIDRLPSELVVRNTQPSSGN